MILISPLDIQHSYSDYMLCHLATLAFKGKQGFWPLQFGELSYMDFPTQPSWC